MRVRSVWHDVDGLRLHARVVVDEAPTGATPLVLVHGLSISSRYMVPAMEALGGEMPCYAPDLPGFGKSQHPPEPLDIPGLADALARWMETAGVPRANVLANSLGCQVATDLAVRHPERVERLVLVCPTVYTRASPIELSWRVLQDAVHEPPLLLAIHLRDDIHARPFRIWRTFEAGRRHPFCALLAHVRQPTLVVRGARDPLPDPGWASEVARLLPRGELVEVHGAPHAMNYTQPELLAEVVRPFLGQARVEPAPEHEPEPGAA